MRPALLLLVLTTACRDPNTRRIDPDPIPSCGDGIINDGEDCDGSNPGSATCQSLGFDSGQLICTADCHSSTSLCTRRCGNGARDLGEACDGLLGVEACATWGYNLCTSTCELDTRHCVAQAFEAAPPLEVAKGGPAVIADLSPAGPGDLIMAVPSFNRVETFPWSQVTGFDATTSRKLSYQHTPLRAEACDANGDGNLDVATLNVDGSIDQLIFTGSGFSLTTVDAGCPSGSILGNGAMGRTATTRDVALACGDTVLLVGQGTARRVPTPDGGATTLADLNADGLMDLVWLDRRSMVHAFLAPTFADDARQALPIAASQLALGDLDGDGDADIVAIAGDELALFEDTGNGYAPRGSFSAPGASVVKVVDLDLDGRLDVLVATRDDVIVRRNHGGWVTREFRLNAGLGPRLSVAVGDVDGDGDADLAATSTTIGDATRTMVIRNRVR